MGFQIVLLKTILEVFMLQHNMNGFYLQDIHVRRLILRSGFDAAGKIVSTGPCICIVEFKVRTVIKCHFTSVTRDLLFEPSQFNKAYS